MLNFWQFTSYNSLKPLWSGMGEVVPARTSPTLHPPSPPTVHQLLSNKSHPGTDNYFSVCGSCKKMHLFAVSLWCLLSLYVKPIGYTSEALCDAAITPWHYNSIVQSALLSSVCEEFNDFSVLYANHNWNMGRALTHFMPCPILFCLV